jgi:hypothetical protein
MRISPEVIAAVGWIHNKGLKKAVAGIAEKYASVE